VSAPPRHPAFDAGPDPDNPGWTLLPAGETGRFVDTFGAMRIRVESDRKVRVRIEPARRHSNILGTVHGGLLLALVDHVLFVAPSALGNPEVFGGVTLDVSAQFFNPVTTAAPVDAVVEILRETGRFVFLRGLIEQAGSNCAAFAGTIRKAK
jgi:uncharacterized protein (TIGR00369 family)